MDVCGCEVKFFKPSAADGPSSAGELLSFSWEVVHSSGVPLRQFYPLLEDWVGQAYCTYDFLEPASLQKN